MKIDSIWSAAVFATFFSVNAMAETIRQGGLALIETHRADLLSASLGEQRLPVSDRGVVVLPVDMDADPGEVHVTLQFADGSRTTRVFDVEAHAFREERLQIANQRYVEPHPEDVERYTREAMQQDKVYSSFSEMSVLPFPMVPPTHGCRSSEFGVRRFFNNQPRSPHSGLDIAAPTGTPIIAPAAGRIALTGDFFFSGKLVMIDHGAGVVSMLGHMNEVVAEEGQWVDQGDLVGKVGATGRVTGAHVHWTLSIGGVRVDPEFAFESPSSQVTRC